MTQFIKISKDDDELMHFGVMGMHWGKRTGGKSASVSKSKAKSIPLEKSDSRKSVEDSYANMKAVKKTSGKKSDEFKNAKEEYRKASEDRNAKIAEANSRMYDSQTTMSKLFLDDPVSRGNAAKYAVDHNMSFEKAQERANKEAVAGTVAMLAIYGGLKLASYAME